MFRNAKMKITVVTLITSYTNPTTLRLVKHSSVQIPIYFTSTLLIFRFVIASMGPWIFDVIECLDNFLCFSLSSRTSPFRKQSVLFFSVGLPRTVCAFVSLTRDNITEQYILHVPRNAAAKCYPNCFLLLLGNISDQTISKSSLTRLSTRSNKIDQSQNKEKKMD